MTPSRRFLLCFLLFFGAIIADAIAEPIRLFYSVGPTTFEVSQFNEGLPVLDTPVDSDIERHRVDGDWSYIGELPVDPEFMSMVFNYTLQKSANLYSSRNDPTEYRVRFRFSGFLRRKLEGSEGDLALFGWLVDGEVRSLSVSPFLNKERRNAELGSKGFHIQPRGKLVAWVIDASGKLKPLNNDSEREEDRLRIAAVNGDVDTLARMFEANRKAVKYKDGQDRTLMMYAASGGRANVVEYLIEKGADPFAEDKSYLNVLDFAGTGGWFEIVKAVASGKAKGTKQKNHYSFGALGAFNAGHQDIAVYLMEKGAALNVNKRSAPGQVLALLASERVELARWIRDKYDVDGAYAENGINFMHAVAGYADAVLFEEVEAGGASATAVSEKGMTPLMVASGMGNRDGICWLMENGGAEKEIGKHDPMMHAIREGAPESVSCLIDYGVSVNREEKEGLSPLMFAATLGEKEIAETLIKAGGVWLFDSQYSDFALLRAIRLNAPSVMEGLFEQGLSPGHTFPGDVGLGEIAAFFDARDALEAIEQTSSGLEVKLVGVKEIGSKPKFKYRTELEYPIEFQEKYGDVDALLKMGITRDGDVIVVEIDDDTPKEVRRNIERLALTWKFEPLPMSEDQLLAELKFSVPLRVSFREEDIFQSNKVDEPPKAIRQVEPYYPFELKMARVKGVVVLHWVIDVDGSVRRIQVRKASHSAFTGPAVDSIKRSVWEPGKIDGKPVAVEVFQTMYFDP